MPNGDCISAEAFLVFQKAYAFYSETKKHQTEIRDAINRFVGYTDIPTAPLTSHYASEARQGVAVEYILA